MMIVHHICIDYLVNICNLDFQSLNSIELLTYCMPKQANGTGIVDIFQFTELECVMAWVVESMNPDRRKHAEDNLYGLFQSHYKKEPSSSIDIFCSLEFSLVL
jgi:hypothetical protein